MTGRVSGIRWDLSPPLVPSRFLCDDVDFNLRVHSAGLLLCRFNRFSVMKKQIAVGGHRSFHITSKVGGPRATQACAPLGLPLVVRKRRWELAGGHGVAFEPVGGLDCWVVFVTVSS